MDLKDELYAEQKPSFWHRYRDHINFNKNILVSGAAGMAASVVSAEVAHYLQNDPKIIALIAAAGKIAAFNLSFLFLQYRSRQEKYLDEDRRTDWQAFGKDMLKIYATALPMAGVFYPMFIGGNNYLLNKNVNPGVSTAASYTAAGLTSQLLYTYIAAKMGILRQSK